MAYVTGSANSVADVLSALQAACTANGWTLSGSVLHKGTCYAKIDVGNVFAEPVNSQIRITAGNGIDGSNALLDPAPLYSHIGILKAATGGAFATWDWPVTYHVHVRTAPDEVYLFVNYGAGQFFQWLAFGQSPLAGNAGTGNWHAASLPRVNVSGQEMQVNGCLISPGGTRDLYQYGQFSPAPFFLLSTQSAGAGASFVHGAMDDTTGAPGWSTWGRGNKGVNAVDPSTPLLSYLPSAWNGESVLLPVQLLQQRPSAKSSLIAQFGHSRLCRNDFIDPGALITLGADRWKVYPCYRKNAAVRDGQGSGGLAAIDHSGTLAIAVAYDGP